MGWVIAAAEPGYERRWLLCPECGRGSVENDNVMLPPQQSFPAINGLSVDISALYDEARASFDARAYTGCEILCRKILMAVAIDKGAEEDKKFAQYVDHLSSEGCITPPLIHMAATIKDSGNRAAHEIDASDRERSRRSMVFTRRILDTVYGIEYDLVEYSGS